MRQITRMDLVVGRHRDVIVVQGWRYSHIIVRILAQVRVVWRGGRAIVQKHGHRLHIHWGGVDLIRASMAR